MSHFVYFFPSWTGLISIQLFSVYHVHIQFLILINEWTNLKLCTSFAIRQQWLPPGVTNCMVFNFNKNVSARDHLLYSQLAHVLVRPLHLPSAMFVCLVSVYGHHISVSLFDGSLCMRFPEKGLLYIELVNSVTMIVRCTPLILMVSS